MENSKLKPFLAYLRIPEHIKLKRFAKNSKLSMTQIVREGILMRMSEGNPYVSGFNDGLNAVVDAVNSNPAFQMRFPSGQSFADILTNEISAIKMKESK